MNDERRVRLSERDSMESGVRCPSCGSYTSFGDIIATGRCSGSQRAACDASLFLDLIVRQ